MKRITALLLAVLLLLGVAGCGSVEAATPEASVNGFFQAMQKGNLDKAEEYLTEDDAISDAVEDTPYLPEAETILKAVCGKIEFKILSTKTQDDGSVKVTISLTTVEMLPLLKDYAEDVLHYTVDYAFKEEKPSNLEVAKRLGEMFRAAASEPELKTHTVELNVIVTETEDGWQIRADNEFVDAVLGGLMDAWNIASQALELLDTRTDK